MDFSFLGEEFQSMVTEWEAKKKRDELDTNPPLLGGSEEDCRIIEKLAINGPDAAPSVDVGEEESASNVPYAAPLA